LLRNKRLDYENYNKNCSFEVGSHLRKDSAAMNMALVLALVIGHETKHFGTGQREDADYKHMRVMGNRWNQSGIRGDNQTGDT